MLSSMKLHILFYCNELGPWYGFPDIRPMHIKVNNGRKSAILIFVELRFFRAYSPPPRPETAHLVLQ